MQSVSEAEGLNFHNFGWLRLKQFVHVFTMCASSGVKGHLGVNDR